MVMYLYGGSSNSNAGLSDWFIKTNNDEIMIMPNIFDISEISYITYPGRIIETENEFSKTENDINLKGIGKIYSIKQLTKNAFYNIYDLNSELMYQFIVIIIFIIASIGGYNTLAVLNYRRILTIYYINGLEWKKGIKIVSLKSLLLILLPVVITSIICTKSISETNQIPFDYRVVLVTAIIYLILYFITTISTILNLKRVQPIEVLKEVD